ncbi:headcase protein homolog [Sorex araneus]|uniref:headcase protein homolog n=1 Tax=Sorex araneus TaxID=42254 RepID=UPI002433DBDB|nr:headcase protein homolog [Sorex araneus]
MPNPKSCKGGRKNKRANSSGDEQENGAGALAAAGGAAGAAAGGAQAAAAGGGGSGGGGGGGAATAGAAGSPGGAAGGGGAGAAHAAHASNSAGAAAPGDAKNEAPCATPLICSFGRPVDLEKDDYQKVVCNNEHCPCSPWMHLQCFYEWESSILVQFNCIGRARSWNEKQCRQNMWTKKGYDLAFRFCSCRCGQGHLKKDTDWYQVKRMQEEKKKKAGAEKSAGRPPGDAAGGEEAKKCRAPAKPPKGLSHEGPRRHSMDRQNSQEKGYGTRSPCGSPGQSPPAGYSILSPAHFGGPRASRYLGEFLKNAIHLEPHKKALGAGHVFRSTHFDYSPAAGGLSGHRGAHFDAPIQFLRRLDLSELLTHIPRHKLNTFHVRMEDDAQVGQGEELRKFILAALSASHRNVVNCALCHRALPVFEQFPLVDGTLFLSPSRHDEIEYDVPCHLQGRLMHLYAVCVDCLEGVHKIICIKCKSRWDGSWHQLGTMYTYDILAASPCCQARLNCKHCGKPVIDVRIGMQYFSEYSNVQQCPHCGNLDYHFVKPFSSFKVLEAY